jgi:hypothetical protein
MSRPSRRNRRPNHKEITVETLAASGVMTILALVALVQLAAALGAPIGAHLYGGRAAGTGEVLPVGHRLASLLTVGVLLAAGWVVLARAGVVGSPAMDSTLAVVGTWVIAGFLGLNTIGNLASTSAVERWGFGAATAAAAVLTVIVAMS